MLLVFPLQMNESSAWKKVEILSELEQKIDATLTSEHKLSQTNICSFMRHLNSFKTINFWCFLHKLSKRSKASLFSLLSVKL